MRLGSADGTRVPPRMVYSGQVPETVSFLRVTAPTSSTSPRQAGNHAPDLHAFEHHWQDEADAAYLYRVLAGSERDAQKKSVYLRLADVEDRHVRIWADLLSRHGKPPGRHRPSARTRLLATLGRAWGPQFLLPMLLAEEGREVKAYIDMHRSTGSGVAAGLGK